MFDKDKPLFGMRFGTEVRSIDSPLLRAPDGVIECVQNSLYHKGGYEAVKTLVENHPEVYSSEHISSQACTYHRLEFVVMTPKEHRRLLRAFKDYEKLCSELYERGMLGLLEIARNRQE